MSKLQKSILKTKKIHLAKVSVKFKEENQKNDNNNLEIPKNNDNILENLKIDNNNLVLNDSESSTDTNKEKSNKIIEKIPETEYEKNERKFQYLYEKFESKFQKKTYDDLIKDIESIENILSHRSLISFNIIIIKIKCLMKILLQEYEKLLKQKLTLNFYEIDLTIQKIKSEFSILYSFVESNDKYEYEKIVQIYCYFLYYLSKISLKKEELTKSFSFIVLGVNMMKIFFNQQKYATEIKTYKIYCMLLAEIINKLIGDNNFDEAVKYGSILLKVSEISLKIIIKQANFTKNNNITNTEIVQKKFIKFMGICSLFTGYCFEYRGYLKIALDLYKHSYYFFNKIDNKSNLAEIGTLIITINNSCKHLALNTMKKIKQKIIQEKIEQLKQFSNLNNIRLLEKKQEERNEKNLKLELVASGFIGNPYKYKLLENKIDNQILPINIQNQISKLEEELITFVDKTKKENDEKKHQKTISCPKIHISNSTKQNMCHYELCNILMSPNFRDFLMKTKKIEFNNPKKVPEAIYEIQSYINSKMKTERNPNRNHSKFLNDQKITSKRNSTQSYNSKKTKQMTKSNLTDRVYSPAITNSQRYLSYNSTVSHKKIKIFKKYEQLLKNKNQEKHIERYEKSDKHLMTQNYFKKYFYFDKLSEREIKFQKIFLKSIEYNSKYEKNDEDGLYEKTKMKEELNQKDLMIFDKVKSKIQASRNEGRNDFGEKEFKYNLFKTNGTKNEMKSAMNRVINKYIQLRKHDNKKNQNIKVFTDKNYASKQNQKILLQLGGKIRTLKSNISQINKTDK